jgi:hypothetical protein
MTNTQRRVQTTARLKTHGLRLGGKSKDCFQRIWRLTVYGQSLPVHFKSYEEINRWLDKLERESKNEDRRPDASG